MGLLFQRYKFLFFLKATNEERCCSLIFIQSWLAFGINFFLIVQWKVEYFSAHCREHERSDRRIFQKVPV